MYTEEDLINLIEWYRTTDFNVEGHSSLDCVTRAFNEGVFDKDEDGCDATEVDIY